MIISDVLKMIYFCENTMTPDLFSHIFRIAGNDISQYTETCEVLLDYPKIGGEDIKYFSKMPLGIFCMQILMYTAEY